MNQVKVASVNSKAEELFVELFCETFGPAQAEKLYVQHPFVDIYGNRRFIDFALESPDVKIAIEIDGETYHNPKKISDNKYYDDLLKQNSMIHLNWKVFRWAYNQLAKQPEKVKDELTVFLGETPFFKELEDFLPKQKGKSFALREYQQEAIDNLSAMRKEGETIALLYHATGVGKTITAATDAKAVGGRTLFLVNALKLAEQGEKTFESIWPNATRGQYTGQLKEKNVEVLFATVQTLSKNLEEFLPSSFDYIIVDECHHAASSTYKKIFSYFKPKFILGLTATPERSDGEDMLELFQNVAHKMDLETAVKKGVLVPISCLRIKTDIDLSDVRVNGIKYQSQDLESKLFVPSRNSLIIDTYIKYAGGKKAVLFCASVDHAKEIARLLQEQGVRSEAVSGQENVKERNKTLLEYEQGNIDVLCACDLLNEGWDSPKTEVLLMARPTMSKTIYLQQLGRGTRKCEGKEHLLVFDFVDNGGMFNTPYSLHRLLNISKYQPQEYVLAPENHKRLDFDMLFKGEKPTIYLDTPIGVDDFELIDLFNWQEEVKGMLSQIEFVRMVDVQAETVDKYVKNGRIKADMAVPFGEQKFFNYFKKETILKYAKEFDWEMITPGNIKDKFINFVETMSMSKSYKPVLLKALMEHIDEDGKVSVEDIVAYFREFYEDRRDRGMVAEKANSIYQRGTYTDKDIENNIFRNPFKRFQDMRFLKRCKDISMVELNKDIFKSLSKEDKAKVVEICNRKLEEYYARDGLLTK